MINRQDNRNKAKEIILQPLLKVILTKKIQLDNRFTLLVNDMDSFEVPSITNNDLENMLNLLYQFSELVDCKPTLSGKAFYVYVKIPLKAENGICKIIPINKYQKVA
jgi:hypothetical protein